MPRYKNELSAIQQDETLFEAMKADIRKFTPHYLTDLTDVSTTTYYKYMNGEAVNPGVEDLILDAIQKAKEIRASQDAARVNRAKQLTAA